MIPATPTTTTITTIFSDEKASFRRRSVIPAGALASAGILFVWYSGGLYGGCCVGMVFSLPDSCDYGAVLSRLRRNPIGDGACAAPCGEKLLLSPFRSLYRTGVYRFPCLGNTAAALASAFAAVSHFPVCSGRDSAVVSSVHLEKRGAVSRLESLFSVLIFHEKEGLRYEFW